MATNRLLVKVRGDGSRFKAAFATAFGAASDEIKPILTLPPAREPGGRAVAPDPGATWLRVPMQRQRKNPWDAVYDITSGAQGFAAADEILFAEPDIQQAWLPPPTQEELAFRKDQEEDPCDVLLQDKEGGKECGAGFAWHLGDKYSALSKAIASFGAGFRPSLERVLVAHLDTAMTRNISPDPPTSISPCNAALSTATPRMTRRIACPRARASCATAVTARPPWRFWPETN